MLFLSPMRLAAAVVLLATLAALDAQTALAQAPGALPPTAPAPPSAPPAPPPPTGLDAAQTWAASNHGLFGSTALTVAEGKVELTAGVVLPAAAVAELNAGLTSSTEVWADWAGVVDISEDGDGGKTYAAGVKQMVARGKQAALALTGSVRATPDGQADRYESVGAVGTLCGDAECGVMLSGAVQHLFGADFGGRGTGVNAFTLSASLGKPTVRLMLDLAVIDGDSLVFAGVRFGNRTAAFDLAFVREDSDSHVPALPWLALSVRL